MSAPHFALFRPQLRTFLTALGMVLVSFGLVQEDMLLLIVALIFPAVSAVWSWLDGNLKNMGSWLNKMLQASPPLLVGLGVVTAEQAAAINGVLLVLISIFPSE